MANIAEMLMYSKASRYVALGAETLEIHGFELVPKHLSQMDVCGFTWIFAKNLCKIRVFQKKMSILCGFCANFVGFYQPPGTKNCVA